MVEKDRDKDERAPSMADALLKVASLIETIKASSDEQTKQMLANQAEQLIRQAPENKFPPLISCFNPAGDRDHPRPKLKCKMFQGGYQVDPETATVEELTLMNRLEPGDFMVTKADGTRVPFTVSAERANDGKIDKLTFTFPSKGDDRHNHMPLTAYLREVLGEYSPSVAQMTAELARLKMELAAAVQHAA